MTEPAVADPNPLQGMADLLLETMEPLPETKSPARRSSRLTAALKKLDRRQSPTPEPAPTPAAPVPVPHFADPDTFDPLIQDGRETEPGALPISEGTGSLATSKSVDDRRAHPRHDSECDAWISLRPPHLQGTSNYSRIRGRVVDVSMGGFALRLSAPVIPGHRIWMSISNRNFSQVLETDGAVLRCTPQSTGDWHVVCRLSRRLTFEQVNFVGKQLFASTLV